ncbi:uncharacterized protein LOC131984610 [Centropristis striata]|uniref:uncharacterized protein LOC131984610 n=1 Tax=Centropristis striata TaxID=184440 RepID=UPI0027E19BEF|nr:uncharacterized protein LOC131984610 [Centropristis striata]
MNLQLGGLLLVVALFTSSSTLTPGCRFFRPFSLTDPSTMYGRWNLLAGFSDCEILNAMSSKNRSSWLNIAQSPNPNEFVLTQHDRINGTCVVTSMTVAVDGDTATMSFGNVSSQFQLRPACDDCLFMKMNSTVRNLNKMLQGTNSDGKITADETSFRHFYLIARESRMQDWELGRFKLPNSELEGSEYSELEIFKQQASCFGFSREPAFQHDPKNEFCAEGEGVKITI